MKKIFLSLLVLLLVCSLSSVEKVRADSEGYTYESETVRDASDTFMDPDMQVVGDKVYYIWTDRVGAYLQIFTAYSDLDGSNFTSTQQTSGNIHSDHGVLYVKGSKIYYIFMRNIGRWEVYTGSSDLDGSNFTSTQHTFDDGSHNHYDPQLYVEGNKIYYSYIRTVTHTGYDLFTAVSNLDGSGWSATQRTTGENLNIFGPQLLVADGEVHYVWTESDGSNDQIWTATTDVSGGSWSATKRTTSVFTKRHPRMMYDGSKLYYVWDEVDGANRQLWLAEMTTGGTGFSATQLTSGSLGVQWPQIMEARSKFYYFYADNNGASDKLVLANSDKDGTNYSSTDLSTTGFDNHFLQFYVDEVNVYYFWEEEQGGTDQVKTAQGDYQIIIDESTTVTASVPSALTFTVAGVTANAACANSGGSGVASVTSTGLTIPFGTYTGAATKIACQTLTVSTNATDGYVITVEQNQDMTSGGSDTMGKFSGTYATPTTWSSPPGSGAESYFGFTTDDTDYSDFQTSKYGSFGANDTPYNISMETDPVSNEVNVISYQLEVTDLQESGVYTNDVMYIATAIF